jgi:hypothetical protein
LEKESYKDYEIEKAAYDPSQVHAKDIPLFPYNDRWFNQEMLYELAYILKSITSRGANQDIKDFFRICFSSIIRYFIKVPFNERINTDWIVGLKK